MNNINISKSTILRHIGNMIAGLCKVIDGIILIISLGTYRTNLFFHWCMYRRTTIFTPIVDVAKTNDVITKKSFDKQKAIRITKRVIGYTIVIPILIFIIFGIVMLFANITVKSFIAFIVALALMLLFAIGLILIKS